MTAASGRSAVVVGAGPNGLVAAITLARVGWDVTVFEANARPGGGTRTEELTLPGVLHDVCSAIHPLAVGSPAFRAIAESDLPLRDHGLEWIQSPVPLAHPLDGGRAAVLHRSVEETADGLGPDAKAYRRLFGPFVDAGFDLTDGLLSPFTIPPKHPFTLARYGAVGVLPAYTVARRGFDTDEAQAMFAGLAGHSILSLKAPVTAGYGLMLGVLAHLVGWPLARGGSQQIADALVAVLEKLGGRVECNRRIESLAELPTADAVLLDLTPRQVLAIAGDAVPDRYRKALSRFRYGPGVFKLDWALDGPIPWANPDCAARGHRAPRRHARRDHRVGVRRAGRPSSRASVRPAGAAESLRSDPCPRRHAGGVGVLPRPQRFDGRHDRSASSRRSSGSLPGSATASSAGMR